MVFLLLWFFIFEVKKYIYLVGRSPFSTHRHLDLNIAALPFWSYIDCNSIFQNVVNIRGVRIIAN